MEVQFLRVDEFQGFTWQWIMKAVDHEKIIGDALDILKDKKIS